MIRLFMQFIEPEKDMLLTVLFHNIFIIAISFFYQGKKKMEIMNIFSHKTVS